MSLHGVGLSIVPGSRVDVNIAVAKWSVKRSWEKIFMHTEKNLVPRTDIAPVYFKAPVTVSNSCKITVTESQLPEHSRRSAAAGVWLREYSHGIMTAGAHQAWSPT